VSRCLLLTDGLANVGITDPAELERHAGELRPRGVVTSTFGVGADFDEALLQSMAVAGGGHFYFIERAQQIPDLIASELGELLETVAREVALEARAPEGVEIEPLSTVLKEGNGNAVRIVLGDLVSGQELDVVLRLNFPRGEIGHRAVATLSLIDRESVMDGPPESLSWEYADHAANESQPRDQWVDRHVAELLAARTRQEAVALNRSGDFNAASRMLMGLADQIRSYAGDDADLNRTVAELRAETPVYAAAMPAMELKQRHFQSSVIARGRDALGKARRRPQA
jgi:Ca-activated chloride channel family protein